MMREKSYSDLPEVIIHHIQSFLGAREGVRSCLLSKSWLHAWSTIPTLKLDQSYFFNPRRPDDLQKREFVEMVTNRLLRYREHKFLIQSLLLSVQFADTKLASFVNNWLEIALNSGLKELHLADMSPFIVPSKLTTVLPSTIFSCPMLETISVSRCQLEIPAVDNFIMCRSLINLKLYKVRIKDKGIHKLLSNCPLIESIILSNIVGLEEIHFRNLLRLKYLEVCATRRTKVCDLDSNALINLRLDGVVIDEAVYDKISSNCPLIEGMYLSESDGMEEIQVGNLHRLRELEIVGSRSLQEVQSHSLRVLKIRMVSMHDEKLDQLLDRCPFIEELTLEQCFGLRKPKVTNLHCLKRFEISGLRIESVEINASTLRSFCYIDSNSLPVQHNPCINIGSAKYLKLLKLKGITISGELFERLISQFHFLEQLAFILCDLPRKINLTCDSLKDFVLKYCRKLVEASIHCPKLARLCHGGNTLSPLDAINISSASTQLETEWTVHNLKCMDIPSFLMLREVLLKSRRCKFSIKDINVNTKDIDFDGLRALPVPEKNLEELSLIIGSCPSEYYSTLLNAIFSICHPQYVIVWSCTCPGDDFSKFFLSELRTRRNTSCCTSNCQDKCWRHYLRDAELVLQEKIANARKYDNKGLRLPPVLQQILDNSMGLPPMFHMISCRLEWSA